MGKRIDTEHSRRNRIIESLLNRQHYDLSFSIFSPIDLVVPVPNSKKRPVLGFWLLRYNPFTAVSHAQCPPVIEDRNDSYRTDTWPTLVSVSVSVSVYVTSTSR